MYRLLLTGTRTTWADDNDLIEQALSGAYAAANVRPADFVVVHGACPTGADRTGARWAKRVGLADEPHPADWETGPGAGPRRNTLMASMDADLCVAFPRPDSRGTWNCIKAAADHGIPVHIHPLPLAEPRKVTR